MQKLFHNYSFFQIIGRCFESFISEESSSFERCKKMKFVFFSVDRVASRNYRKDTTPNHRCAGSNLILANVGIYEKKE